MTVRWNVSISSQQSHDDVCEEVSLRPKFSVILPVCHGGKFLAHALATLAVASLVVEELKGFFFSAFGVYTAGVILTGSKGAVKKKRAVPARVIPGLIVALHVAKAAGYMLPFSVKENYNP
ncbi:MAG: hypothetical protein H6Q49_1948 [Deltaproteobacteria bacterium]|nr:hypothetical protein [Deltaproteobacteria bacterium]